MLAEDSLNGQGLAFIVERCRGAMGIYIVDLMRFDFSIAQSFFDRSGRSVARFVGRDNVGGVATGATTDDFSVNRGVASERMLQLFQDEDDRTLAYDKAISVGSEGAAGLFGEVISSRQGHHIVEGGNCKRVQAGFTATRT